MITVVWCQKCDVEMALVGGNPHEIADYKCPRCSVKVQIETDGKSGDERTR